MARPYDILTIGDLNVDIIVSGDVVPEFGQVEKLVDDLSVVPGSSAAIFASGAAHMGLQVLFASRVGDDLFGRFSLDALRGAGVDPSHVTVDPTIKTCATIHLAKPGDRAMLTFLGSLAEVSLADFDPAWLSQARHMHVASPFLLTKLRPHFPELMRAAREAGMTVSLDTNWDPSGAWQIDAFLEHVDIFLPNENELRAITRCQDLEQAIASMAARVPLLVLKRGAEGALAVRGAERAQVPAFPVEVVDTTGAGDTFDGGFLAGWLRGETLERCLLLGAACGSLSTTAFGGFGGQPTWEEANALIRASRH